MAEKAMHDRDYRAQLERSAYGHDKPTHLSELNAGIEKGMAALRQKHINDEKEAWANFCRQATRINRGGNFGVSRQTTSMNGEENMTELCEMNARGTENVSWTKVDEWLFTVSQQARCRPTFREKLTFGQPGQRFIQCTPESDNVGYKSTHSGRPPLVPTHEIAR